VSDPAGDHGISEPDMHAAVDAEYAENEIFPKSDDATDWLKLLDVEPESVVSVKPIRPDKGEAYARSRVI
jgi:proteasome-associated ATPase